MSAFAFKLDVDDHVKGWWSGRGPEIPTGQVEVTAADFNTVQTAGLRFDGSAQLRWKYTSSVLVEQTDTRPSGIWSDTRVDLDIGDPPGQVTLTLSSTPNGSRIVEFDSGHRLRLTFVAGVTTVDIPTSTPFETVLGRSPTIRLTNALRIRVLGNDIYPIV